METTNFLRETHFRGSSANLHLVERFTRINDDTLLYEYTASDPTTFSRPWTVQMPMKRSDANLYEYACHEGNYGMFNLLAGARAEEAEAAGRNSIRTRGVRSGLATANEERAMGIRVACLLVGLVLLVPAAVQAQGAAGNGDPATPRTPWGDPDLQGTWTNTTTTPLERPAALAGKDVLSAEERAAIDEENAPGIDAAIGVGAYNNFWMERGYVYEQTSLVVDPPDGRLPGNYAMANMLSGARDQEAAAAKRAGSE